MGIPYNGTELVISATVAEATGTAPITGADGWREYQFGVVIGTAAYVIAEWSLDGTARWMPAAGAISSSGTIQCRGIYPYLRLRWAGNTGTITADMVRSDDRQVL